MKTHIQSTINLLFLSFGFAFFSSCNEQPKENNKDIAIAETLAPKEKSEPKKPLSQEFKAYWYAGEAEITSYKLEQARYGELREGNAVLIYVTEPFLPEIQVKADNPANSNIPVLKLNATKNFLTGIYPYSIMSSTFYPVYDNKHAIKTSLSMQEWCGHVYAQLNNREQFEITSHSYFENEADQNLVLDKVLLENEIWNKIRINPRDLPQGEIELLPSLEFFRLKHGKIQAQQAFATLEEFNGLSTYTIDYKNIERKLSITFSSNFPFEIEEWTEEYVSGFGPNAKLMKSKATKLKSLKTPYWRQNSVIDTKLRKELDL